MTILTHAATVIYNGYQFDGASHISISCEPVYDEAERAVIYHRYKISVNGVIAGEPATMGTDVEMQSIRSLLTKPGKELQVFQFGFYDLLVNTLAGGVNDVAFGPKPRLVSWTPIGSLYAAEFQWECETCVVFCGDLTDSRGVIAFNYGVTFAIDQRGLTVRTISGYLEIANNRTAVNAQTIRDDADQYRSRCNPAIPSKFQRTNQTYTVSPDRRRLDFTIVDTELAENNPWPQGAVRVEGKHRVGWTRRGGGAGRLRNSITIDVELAPNQPLLNAYAIFADAVKKRIDIAKAAYGNGVLMEGLDVQEDLYGRGASFSVNYTVCAPLQQLLADCGLWTPLGINTWGQWAASIGDVTDHRGWANLDHHQSQDVIVDPCGAVFTMPWDRAPVAKAPAGVFARTLLKNTPPPADKSWLEYESHVYMVRDRATIRQAVMQKPETEDPSWNPLDIVGLVYNAVAGRVQDILQRCGVSRYTAALVGHAKRAGYPIMRPALATIGGAATTETGGDFVTRISGNWLGVPIYVARWLIYYQLATEPGNVQPTQNVHQGVLPDGTAVQPTGP